MYDYKNLDTFKEMPGIPKYMNQYTLKKQD